MNRREMEEKIIEGYRQDEKMMILVYAQWCINHDLDPIKLYKKAYPDQVDNHELHEAVQLTVSKKESETIPDETLFGVLSLFGNEELAFVITTELKK
ncbi:hypothetical protein [Alteribacillus sp. HJP-4]|uniref:hypothetical protein n=1 Tax=Alteribacillus sp. HJP-4 TaxID=2775394 RepID=UPI0035CCE2BF